MKYLEFEYLQLTILNDVYKNLFPIILTDNGHEFFDVLNIECNHKTGEVVTKLFFCDPHVSSQKSMIEKNHINSLCRDSLNGKYPYEAM